MRSFLLMCALIGATFAASCYIDSNSGQSHSDGKVEFPCSCDYCAKGYGKVKGDDGKTFDGSVWGCGCGIMNDIATPYDATCTKNGKTSIKYNGDKATMYCCKGDRCNSATSILSLSIASFGLARMLF